MRFPVPGVRDFAASVRLARQWLLLVQRLCDCMPGSWPW